MKQNYLGFTLIELLVVVAIIGVLSSVVLASLSDARSSARDARRMADLRNMQTALELYYNDHDKYPGETWCDSSIGSYGSNCGDMISSGNTQDGWDTNSTFYQEFVGGGYASLPEDPLNNESYYYYYEPSNDGHQGHFFRTTLEDGGTWGVCSGTLEGYRDWCN